MVNQKGSENDAGNDILQEIPIPLLEEFMKDLKGDIPSTIHIYSFIYALLKWKKKRPQLDAHFLAPHGDPQNGIVLFNIMGSNFDGTVYAKDEASALCLKEALRKTKKLRIETSKMVLFTCMTHTSFKALEDITGPEWCLSKDTVFWLPWYAAREMEIHLPEDVELRELSPEHAKQMNRVWPHRYDESEDLIRDTIDVHFGFGVFRGDKLLSWGICWFYGGIGVLQTEESEKRKGYARAVAEAVTKRFGELQIDVHLNVVQGNEAGLKFFTSLGFRYAFNSVWASRGHSKKSHPADSERLSIT